MKLFVDFKNLYEKIDKFTEEELQQEYNKIIVENLALFSKIEVNLTLVVSVDLKDFIISENIRNQYNNNYLYATNNDITKRTINHLEKVEEYRKIPLTSSAADYEENINKSDNFSISAMRALLNPPQAIDLVVEKKQQYLHGKVLNFNHAELVEEIINSAQNDNT